MIISRIDDGKGNVVELENPVIFEKNYYGVKLLQRIVVELAKRLEKKEEK